MKFLIFIIPIILCSIVLGQKVINTNQDPNQNIFANQSIIFEPGAQIIASNQSKLFAFIDANSDGVPDYDVELTSNTLDFSYDVAGNQIKRLLNIVIVSARSSSNSEEVIFDKIELIPETTKTTVFQVYPNPSNGPLNIRWNNINDGVESIELYDLAGGQIKNYTITNRGSSTVEINISNVPTGIYIIRFKTNNGEIINKKIIKK